MHIHMHVWCANNKDEVEKLEYQWNEEAGRTERSIGSTRVRYSSTCTHMQLKIMGECRGNIKHAGGVSSAFRVKRLHNVAINGINKVKLLPQCNMLNNQSFR